jgi:hypothetical protein
MVAGVREAGSYLTLRIARAAATAEVCVYVGPPRVCSVFAPGWNTHKEPFFDPPSAAPPLAGQDGPEVLEYAKLVQDDCAGWVAIE